MRNRGAWTKSGEANTHDRICRLLGKLAKESKGFYPHRIKPDWSPLVLIICCCRANHPKFSILKQESFIISHNFMGQEKFGQLVLACKFS